MNTIKDLIQETEKKFCEDMERKFPNWKAPIKGSEDDVYVFSRNQAIEMMEIVVKQCQTIADETIKNEIKLIEMIKDQICRITPEIQLQNNTLKEVCPNIFYNCEKRLEYLKQQLNPAQKEDE